MTTNYLGGAVAVVDAPDGDLTHLLQPHADEDRLVETLADLWTRLLRAFEGVTDAEATLKELIAESEPYLPAAKKFAAESVAAQPDQEVWGQGFVDILALAVHVQGCLASIDWYFGQDAG
jgi:hypothetical protein